MRGYPLNIIASASILIWKNNTCQRSQLTDLPQSQVVTLGRFIVGNQKIETHAWVFQKMLDLFGIPYIGEPQASNHKHSPLKQVLAIGRPPGTSKPLDTTHQS